MLGDKRPEIENIIFDLGGVLFDIDYPATFHDMGELLGIDLTPGNWPPAFRDFIISYDKGMISTEVFLWKLQKFSRKGIPTPDKIIKAWNAMLIDWSPGALSLLKTLGSQYRLILLSNINELHYQYLTRSFHHDFSIDDFNGLFFGVCYSHLTGMVKPEPEIYKHVIDNFKLVPGKTLYIDDFRVNVEAALEIGINAVQHPKGHDISTEIFSYLEFAK